MSLSPSSSSFSDEQSGSATCPVHAHALPQQKTRQLKLPVGPPIECDADGVWHVRGFEEARAILRSKDTRQAGFNADQVGSMKMLHNKPILYLEGKEHNQQRKQTARFFTPRTVDVSYRHFIEQLADQLIEQIKQKKTVALDRLSLILAVEVASRVVGLTNSSVPGMNRRLDIFLHMNLDEQQASAPRWKPLRILKALWHQRHMLSFFLFDVKPAIRARKRQLQEDVISHLIGLNYSDAEILTECVTYAAAGMATTREFISLAAWHLLEHPDLRARYLAAPEEERCEILHEMLRLDPVVGHLFRYATAPIVLQSGDRQFTIPEGALIDLHLYATNVDERVVVGDCPLAVLPGRPLEGERVPSMLMSFGDGAHRCPGAFLAIQESDIFLQRLLALEHLRIVRPPSLAWNDAVYGYELRDFQLASS